MLRYQENNELHRDFHDGVNFTCNYLVENYGVEALKKVLRRTGREVYKSIREKLAQNDPSELIEHLNWFYLREGAPYQLTVSDTEIRFECFECPAHKHLKKLGLPISEYNCLQTSETNAGICEDTGWESFVEHSAPGHCVQIFRKKVQK